MAHNDAPTDSISAEHDFSAGQFARDTDEQEVVLVVGTPDVRAEDYEIEALAGKSVAGCNPSHPADDPVVEVVYVGTLNHFAQQDSKLSEWTPAQIAGMHASGTLAATRVTVYSMPASRIQPTGADSEESDTDASATTSEAGV